jgi:hypothetical protein
MTQIRFMGYFSVRLAPDTPGEAAMIAASKPTAPWTGWPGHFEAMLSA